MRGMNVEESCLCINHVWVDAILASPHTFMGGFWPTSKWTKGGIHSPPHGADITLRDHESYPYCNLGWDKPHPPFNPWRDFLVGDCVMVMPDTTEIEVYRIGACMASEGPHMCRKQHGTYNVWRIQSGVLRTCGAIVSNKKKIGTRIVGWSHEQKPPQRWNILTAMQLYTPKDPKKRIARHMLYLKLLP